MRHSHSLRGLAFAGRLLIFTCLLFAVASCASHDSVRLVYTPAAQESVPPVGAPKVCVVMFTDARNKVSIGQHSDGSTFVPGSDVREWLSTALASELSRQNIVVTLANSEAEAIAGGARYIVTGVIDEVWLVQESSTLYSCTMRASMMLRDAQVKDARTSLFKNNFSSSLSRRVVPLSSVPQEMLTEAAGDLVRPMALAVRQKLMP